MKFVETTFSSAEAAIITGITPIRQRDWRRHGYISEGEGRKRRHYSIREVAQLAITGQLDELGVKPGISTSMPSASVRHKKSAATIVANLVKSDPIAMSSAARSTGKLQVSRNWNTPRFLLIFHAGSRSSAVIQLADDLQASFDGSKSGAIVIDLKAIARQIIDRSAKPLVRLAEETNSATIDGAAAVPTPWTIGGDP